MEQQSETPRILVVDDEPGICGLLQKFLESHHYEVLAVNNGQAALEQMPIFRPHLVLLDVKMPGLSGLQVLEQLRKDYAQIPVMMITACDDEDTIAEAHRLGASDYVIKPFDFSYLSTSLLKKLATMGRPSDTEQP